MSPLIHFIYASVATVEFGPVQLTDLLQQARKANERLGLTGMLLHSGGSFFQVLEGEPQTVDQLYQKILLDPRHSQFTVIIREPIARRSFGSWSMGFSSVSPKELAGIEGMNEGMTGETKDGINDGRNDFFQGGSCFAQLDASRTKKLLTAFAEGRWRAKITGPTVPVA